jgi:Flp pilus assembly protein TadD
MDRAVASFRKAVGINPHRSRSHFSLGTALGRSGDIGGAIESYQKAIELSPANPAAHYNLGLLLERTGDYESAHAAFVAGKPAAPVEARSAMARCKAAAAARSTKGPAHT